MTQDKNIIYVNGCSFTRGIDIGDYILEGYPDEISFNDYMTLTDSGTPVERMLAYNQWRNDQYEKMVLGNPGLNYAGLSNRRMREVRYSSILENLLGIPVINNAAPGNDNHSIYLRTCNDVYNLKKQGYLIKKIIFQFTCRTRHSYIKEITDADSRLIHLEYNKLDDEFFCRSINYASMNLSYDSYTNAERYFVEKDTVSVLEMDMQLKTRWLNHFSKLKMYKDAIHGETGIEPIMVDSIFTEVELERAKMHNLENNFDFLYNPDQDTYIGRTVMSLFPQGMDSMAKMMSKYEKSITAGLHFNKEVHERFAKHLAEKYFNE